MPGPRILHRLFVTSEQQESVELEKCAHGWSLKDAVHFVGGDVNSVQALVVTEFFFFFDCS